MDKTILQYIRSKLEVNCMSFHTQNNSADVDANEWTVPSFQVEKRKKEGGGRRV